MRAFAYDPAAAGPASGGYEAKRPPGRPPGRFASPTSPCCAAAFRCLVVMCSFCDAVPPMDGLFRSIPTLKIVRLLDWSLLEYSSAAFCKTSTCSDIAVYRTCMVGNFVSFLTCNATQGRVRTTSSDVGFGLSCLQWTGISGAEEGPGPAAGAAVIAAVADRAPLQAEERGPDLRGRHRWGHSLWHQRACWAEDLVRFLCS